MPQNDIYNSEKKYSDFKDNIGDFLNPPKSGDYRKKYYCQNKQNLTYFKRLFAYFEARDSSYIRRLRLLMSMKLICHVAKKDLKTFDRPEIDKIVAFMHTQYKSPKSKSDFLRDIKQLWKILFPENDEKGRPDETITPYPVRHLSAKIDKSKERLRQDRLTLEEFEKIVAFFSDDPRLQAYLMISFESLGRPQELLYTKVRDVELYDNYAKLWISSHGKEGTGFLQVIDSYPYLIKWLNTHPLKNKKDGFLFINLETGFGQQLRPENINKHLKKALKHLKIDKPITAYSLKRNGVTMRRLRGDSDIEIQHAARWTSTKQLKTYDMSQQEDALKIQLAKRGMITDDAFKQYQPENKTCIFCNSINGFNEVVCDNCKRPLDREKINSEMKVLETAKKDLADIKAFMKWIETNPKLKKAIEDEIN